MQRGPEVPGVGGGRPLGRLSEISHFWLHSFLFNRLQRGWSIVTVTAPEPTSLTIRDAMTVMMTCHGLGPEKEGKHCAGRVKQLLFCCQVWKQQSSWLLLLGKSFGIRGSLGKVDGPRSLL